MSLPVEIHSHSTTGLASMTYYAGLEAGADIVDTAISPFSLGTSQPPTESMVAALAGGEAVAARSKVSGVVRETHVRVGDRITSGAVVARIEKIRK